MSPDTVVEDAPITIRNWSPVNFDRQFRGPMTVADAVTQSINTVAVRVSETVGRQRVIDVAHRLGISQALEDNPSLALGASEVTLLDLTQAFGAFATGGEAVRAFGFTEVRDSDGRVLYRRRAGSERVISPENAGQMTQMLANVVQRGTGRAARLDRPVAGKTGTTTNSRDALFVGFTADLITGVWFGNDDNTPMKGVTGGQMPAELWGAFMRKASEGTPPRPLPMAPPRAPWYAPWRGVAAPDPQRAPLAPSGYGYTPSPYGGSSPAYSAPRGRD
jgi:penicillin-binding protein 1A